PRVEDFPCDHIDDGAHVFFTFSSAKPFFFTIRSISTSVSSRPCIRPRGQEFGPSESAFSGAGCVSMNSPAMPLATAARASTGMKKSGLSKPTSKPQSFTPRRPTACRPDASRSEEHTSELQSRFDLVCRLLLEEKKKSTT